MANIVLVTRQCYLLCESINYISVHELSEEDKEDSLFYTRPPKRRKRKMSAKEKLLDKLKRAAQLYQISIDFVPVQNSNANANNGRRGDGTSSVNITVRGYDRCIELYMDMIQQIREQQPDKLFLDKMVEKFFAENPVEKEET